MDINTITEALGAKEAVASFKTACDAKAKFFDQLRGVIADFAPGLLEKAKLEQADYKLALDKYNREHKYDNYQFRFNKKYTTAAIFVPVKDMNIGAHDTLTFRGRKADHPETLVFLVSTPNAENVDGTPADRTVEIEEHLFISWLKNDMVH